MKYRRRISADEARGGYLLVPDDRRQLFPDDDTEFAVHVGDASFTCTVEAEDTSPGGVETHFIHFKVVPVEGRLPLKPGQPVTIRSDKRAFRIV